MSERTLRSIKDHLQTKDAQERIQQHILRGRSEATVTIGRAARLFNFSENQLRDWEVRGLLNPLRSKDTTGQRQYSLTELDKLAIIRELIDAGYTPGEVPTDVDTIWYSISPSSERQDQISKINREETEHLHINQRIEHARKELFWRYYASHVLRLSLALICEDIPETAAGLVLPLCETTIASSVHHIDDLSKVGESLIGWLSKSRSSHTLLTVLPSFEYNNDYRLLPLQVMNEDIPEGGTPKDRSWILLDRQAKPLTLTMPVVETIRRLLAPLYQEVHTLRSCFGQDMRDQIDPATNFNSSANYSDIILDGLADMVVHLGGQTADANDLWRFCCILLPKDLHLPVQQRSLVVRAQSKHAPHKTGITMVSPNEPAIGLSLRAFQSGHVVYRHEISVVDPMIAYRDKEGPIRSAIALPIGGENGTAEAVLYIVSDETDAFSDDDQRVLRMMGRMIEELLLIYRAREQAKRNFRKLIERPGVVDTLFENFWSENDFIQDVEALLISINTRMKKREELRYEEEGSLITFDIQSGSEQPFEEVSFIAIDIDNQGRLANKYGDQMMRNLSREVGQRIQEQLRVLFTEHVDCRLYHVYADRFYLLLKGISLEQAREKAKRIKLILKGPYQLDALHPSIEEPTRPDSMHVLSVSVRLGVTSYPYIKLEDLLQRYTAATAVANVRAIISRDLDRALEKGRIDGGDVVISWEPDIWGYVQLH